jgi:hypothetical protein
MLPCSDPAVVRIGQCGWMRNQRPPDEIASLRIGLICFSQRGCLTGRERRGEGVPAEETILNRSLAAILLVAALGIGFGIFSGSSPAPLSLMSTAA